MDYIEHQGYKIRETFNKKFLILSEAKNFDVVINYMNSENITGLELNYRFGFTEQGLLNLSSFSFIEHLNILNHNIKDITPIHGFSNLKTLIIQTEDKTPIDFKCFPKLVHCSLRWRKGAESLYDCHSLKHLSIRHYKERTLRKLKKLNNLIYLGVANSGTIESLKGVEELQTLLHLELHYLTKLTSLKYLESCTDLSELRIGKCRKITSIDPIIKLRNLEVLQLDGIGEISSLAPLASLEKLAYLYFGDTTKVMDGDMSVLLKIKSLEKVIFPNKKSYTHTGEQIINQLESKWKNTENTQ